MQYDTIDRSALMSIVTGESIDNADRGQGVALVNVLEHDRFERKHIPNSINIPLSEIDEFDARFDKSKAIVVYCASASCDASPRAAALLSERGFRHVSDYEGGVADWEAARQPLAGIDSTPSEVPS